MIQAASRILMINGPNLNLLGSGEPDIYGNTGLPEITALLAKSASDRGIDFKSFQSNHEGALVDWVQEECRPETGVIINPGAFTHTSIALRDALLARAVRLVEVHISNIHTRESFRRHSYFSDIAVGVIAGLGVRGYLYAFDYLCGLPLFE